MQERRRRTTIPRHGGGSARGGPARHGPSHPQADGGGDPLIISIGLRAVPQGGGCAFYCARYA
eukprot:4625223-Karenia_brevis.AAC.1